MEINMHATDEQIAKLATEQIEAERSTGITDLQGNRG
jgi:hypothetical protein